MNEITVDIKNDRNSMNEIFKNLINNIMSKHQKLHNRYKFLNSFWMLEKIKSQLQSKINKEKLKLHHITNLFEFTETIIENEFKKNILNKNLYLEAKEIISDMNELKLKTIAGKINGDSLELKSLYDMITKFVKSKKIYCEQSFKKIRWAYNNWEIKSIDDISQINNFIYHFISTRLMWGFSWKKIKKVLHSFSKHSNFWDIDFMTKAVQLRVKHDRTIYETFVPIKIDGLNKRDIWIKNFNELNNKVKIVQSKEVEECIVEKTAQNLQNINIDAYYISYKTEQLDPYSSIQEVIRRVLPSKLGRISALTKHINISDEDKIIVISNMNNKQFFWGLNLKDSNYDDIFSKDFIIIPELKYKSHIKKTYPSENFFSLIYINEEWKKTEHKYLATYLLFEKTIALIKSLNFKSTNHDMMVLQIANIDINLEYYINNSFLIKEHYSSQKEKKYKNDLEFLKDFLYDNSNDSPKNYFQLWTEKNTAPDKIEKQLIYQSLKYFKDLAAQTRHKIVHVGKKIDFFDDLIIETLDSILTLALLRIFDKNILSEHEMLNQFNLLQEGISEKDFEKIKKVL